MNPNPFVGIINNLALLLVLALLYDLIIKRSQPETIWHKVLSGIAIGTIGVAVMMTAWQLSTGVVFDTRSILLAVSGLFFGTIPTLIGLVFMAGYRIFLGGDGTLMGVGVIVTSALVGLIWRRFHKKQLDKLPFWEAYMMGLVVHLIMIAWMTILPQSVRANVISSITPPVILLYPPGTALLCRLFSASVQKLNMQEALAVSQKNYQQLVDNINAVILRLDEHANIRFINRFGLELFGFTEEELLDQNIVGTILPAMSSDGEDLAAMVQSVFEEPEAFETQENENICKDGSRLWILWKNRTILNEHGEVKEFFSVGNDLTETRKAQEALEKYSRRLEALHEIDKYILTAQSREETIQSVLNQIHKVIPSTANLVFLFDEDLQASTTYAMNPEQFSGIRSQKYDEAVEGKFLESLQNGTIFQCPDLAAVDEEIPDSILALVGDGKFRSYLYGPLLSQGQLLGTVSFFSRQPHFFTDELRDVIKEVTDQLSIALNQVRLTERIQGYANDLERRVQERTRQLEAANKELEAFSYSVSHDLRAPLRAMDGFSLALLEDNAEQLDTQGKKYLNRVRNAAQQMGALIEDLLRLSRVTRFHMEPEQVNLSKMTNSILKKLQITDPARKLKSHIQPEVFCSADPNLIEIVMENLLNNAWKFSSKNETRVIEFGTQPNEHEQVYYIKDNGVGFKMEYADNLFTPFQRLHHRDQFEGSGIGLATVSRIIHRHNGQVWAEAAEGEGATFFFTLGIEGS
ncbi:MAG: PAS domain S-box protein [Anaerolineaceae bacterium]|nr:PAS domain S-box protein [Anaerolineaceae bacterium]